MPGQSQSPRLAPGRFVYTGAISPLSTGVCVARNGPKIDPRADPCDRPRATWAFPVRTRPPDRWPVNQPLSGVALPAQGGLDRQRLGAATLGDDSSDLSSLRAQPLRFEELLGDARASDQG